MGKIPLVKNGSRHGGHSAGRLRCACQNAMKQPLFEYFRIGILLDCALEKLPLYRQTYSVGRLVALAASPPSFGSFERGE